MCMESINSTLDIIIDRFTLLLNNYTSPARLFKLIVILITSLGIIAWFSILNVVLLYILAPSVRYCFNLSFFWSLSLSTIVWLLVVYCWFYTSEKNTSPIKVKANTDAIVKIKIVCCMTVGPPAVGKTTLKEQILYGNQDIGSFRSRSSTQIVGIEKNRFIANDKSWNSVTPDEEFTKVIGKSMVSYRKYYFCSTFTYLCLTGLPTWIAALVTKFTDIGKDMNSEFKYLNIFQLCVLVTSALVITLLFCACLGHDIILNICERIDIKCCRQEYQNGPSYPETLLIHFRDSGGQPEFHEVAPALVPHSTLYLLMFNLNEDLNKRYNVTYKASEDDITDPYQSSFTVKQVLLQLLASIQSFYHSSQDTVPNALIIGTHKDLLIDKESRINQVQQELEEEIRGTDCYKNDTIIRINRHLLLPINTFNQNDVKVIKDMLSKNMATMEYIVPLALIRLYYNIEKFKKSVVSLNEFKWLANKYDINDQNELTEVIKFLQDKLGSIRYFGSVPELKHIVITDPQILVDLVNELIVCTFTFKNPTMSQCNQTERFRSSGRFKKQSLKNCEVVKNGLLTEDQVISILQHLNIIAPVGINDEGEEEYFLPCVLVHAPVSTQPTSINTTGYSPLLITFKCGYTPRGVFSCLISSILCSSEGLWVLASEEIYRDQVKFHLTNRGDIVLIKNCLKYLEVSVTVCRGSTISDVPFSDIQNFLSKHLTIVLKDLNYSLTKVAHSFGFYCSFEHCDDDNTSDLHIAQCIGDAYNPHTKCAINPALIACLSSGQAVWFKADSHTKLKNTFDIRSLDTILQFLSEVHYDTTSWQRLGLKIGIYEKTLKEIECDTRLDGSGVKGCLQGCLSAWLRQEDGVREKGAPSWFTLATALDAIGERHAANIAYTKNIK